MIPVQLMLLHPEGYNYSVFDLTRRDRVQIQVTLVINMFGCFQDKFSVTVAKGFLPCSETRETWHLKCMCLTLTMESHNSL